MMQLGACSKGESAGIGSMQATSTAAAFSFPAVKASTTANQEAVAQMAMPYAYDMTGKMLVFDVKFDSTDSAGR